MYNSSSVAVEKTIENLNKLGRLPFILAMSKITLFSSRNIVYWKSIVGTYFQHVFFPLSFFSPGYKEVKSFSLHIEEY